MTERRKCEGVGKGKPCFIRADSDWSIWESATFYAGRCACLTARITAYRCYSGSY